jgi:Mg-chelatase subunit ChlD
VGALKSLFVPVLSVIVTIATAPQCAARERVGHVDVFIILDESGSMKPVFGKVATFIAEALVRDYLEPGDYLCVVGFSDAPRIRVSQRLGSDAERDNLVSIVRELNVVPEGHTDMGRALEATARQLETLAHPAHQPIVLVITDGLNQPPRDSPYFSPVRPDRGVGFAPPSSFNAAFLGQVRRYEARGYKIHVVGIGLETDAASLARALNGTHTILRSFRIDELRRALADFWDETISLVALEYRADAFRAGATVPLRARLRSSTDKDGAIILSGARMERLDRRSGLGAEQALLDQFRFDLAQNEWSLPARGEAVFDLSMTLPKRLSPDEYSATIVFEQESAVRFYPPQARIAFRVPSFWDLHGRTIVVSFVLAIFILVGATLRRRRPIGVTIAIEGEAPATPPRPVRIAIGHAFPIGGGATDRFRIQGLPQRVAVLERRSVERFAILSSKPEVIPTCPEYDLGDPVDVRGDVRRTVRFIRAGRKHRRPRKRRPRPARAGVKGAPGGIDFR